MTLKLHTIAMFLFRYLQLYFLRASLLCLYTINVITNCFDIKYIEVGKEDEVSKRLYESKAGDKECIIETKEFPLNSMRCFQVHNLEQRKVLENTFVPETEREEIRRN
jgi:hypothetical protein